MIKLLALITLVLALTGCATAPPLLELPEGQEYICLL